MHLAAFEKDGWKIIKQDVGNRYAYEFEKSDQKLRVEMYKFEKIRKKIAMNKMYWQADSEEKSLFRLFFGSEKIADFAFINENYGIGKVTDAARKTQVWIIKADEETSEIFNVEGSEKTALLKFDASGNGEVRFSDKATFKWTQFAETSSVRVWKDNPDENLAVFELDKSKNTENFVELKLSPQALENKHTYLLILLGWALIVTDKRNKGIETLANGNPQKFLAEDKIKDIFSIKFSCEEFSKQIAVIAALAGTNAVASDSSIGAEEIADVAGFFWDLLDRF